MNMKRNKWRMILDIARTELQTLFYSPIAWLTLIIFVVQASMTFSSVFASPSLISFYQLTKLCSIIS